MIDDLRRDVTAELEWDPAVRQAQVTVRIDDGVVTLLGSAPSGIARCAAESAAWRVHGVKAVVNGIEVKASAGEDGADEALARTAAACLANDALLPTEGLHASVKAGWVTLTGTVTWQYQRQAAEQSMRRLRGVAGVTNLIAIVPEGQATDVAQKIESALRRCAGLDAQWITVEAYKDRVVLRGSVRSWSEREQAASVAWCAPGVVEVLNNLTVLP
jgi:osmotically-inducible protein OsmY